MRPEEAINRWQAAHGDDEAKAQLAALMRIQGRDAEAERLEAELAQAEHRARQASRGRRIRRLAGGVLLAALAFAGSYCHLTDLYPWQLAIVLAATLPVFCLILWLFMSAPRARRPGRTVPKRRLAPMALLLAGFVVVLGLYFWHIQAQKEADARAWAAMKERWREHPMDLSMIPGGKPAPKEKPIDLKRETLGDPI